MKVEQRESKTGESAVPSTGLPAKSNGGYRTKRIPWGWIITVGVGLMIVTNIVKANFYGVKPLPEGLLQSNGRLEGDHVIVSAKYAGRIGNLAVREGDSTSRGQVLLEVDDPETKAKRDQRAAALNSALAQASGSSANVDLTRNPSDAILLQSKGLVDQSQAAADAARTEVTRTSANVESATSAKAAADQGVRASEAAKDLSLANVEKAAAGLDGASSALIAARAQLKAAQANVSAAKSAADQASREARRTRSLADEGALAVQRAEEAQTAADQATANLASAKEQATVAESMVSARLSDVTAARIQLKAAQVAVRQAEAGLVTAKEQASSASSGVRQAAALRNAALSSVRQADSRTRQAIGQLKQAMTGPTQVAISKTAKASAIAAVQQAKAALLQIDSTLDEMKVRSPISGTVITRFQDQGELVNPGSPIFELVNLDRLYLKVYVPEDMIGKVHLGLQAQIWTDSYPSQPFPAHVGFVASQAEFTPKEIQTSSERVSLMYEVRLYLDGNPSHMLSPGLPADAIIRWKEGVQWQKPR